MKTETTVQLFIGVLTAITSIVAAIIGATWKAEVTATRVATSKVEELAPKVKLFVPLYTRRNEVQYLGEFQVCTLITAGETHHNQACTCFIEPVNNNAAEWQLRVHLDPRVDGQCNCRAACFNGLSEET